MVIRVASSEARPRSSGRWPATATTLAVLYLLVVASLVGSHTVIGSRVGGRTGIHIPSYPIFDCIGALAVPTDPDDPRWHSTADAAGSVAFRAVVRRSGFFAPTIERRELLLLQVTLADGSLPTPAQDQSIRASLADLLDAMGRHPSESAMLRGGPTTISRVLWSGYVINAFALVALGMVGCSLWRGVRRGVVAPWFEDIRHSRVERGLCPRCRYDVSTVPSDVCPECGGALTAEESPRPPPRS